MIDAETLERGLVALALEYQPRVVPIFCPLFAPCIEKAGTDKEQACVVLLNISSTTKPTHHPYRCIWH